MAAVRRWLTFGLAVWLMSANAANAAYSAQDVEMSISPVVRIFPVTALGGTSKTQSFIVKNGSTTAARTIGSVTLEGVDAAEFAIGTDLCSGQTLSPGASCSVAVVFKPLTRGTKNAELRVPSNDPESPVVCAFLTNQISARVEAQLRQPPVLSANAIPETMMAGQTYTLSWTLDGYNDSYVSYAALFDCTGITDGTCGNNYGDLTRFAVSPALTPAVSTGKWTFRGERTQTFRFDWVFSMPATRKDGTAWAASGTEIVVRFYYSSNVDAARRSSTISLLIPGNQSDVYYDTAGRRIVKLVTP